MADMDPILEVAREHGIPVVEDCAQSQGAEYRGRRAGSLGTIGCYSFYPSKNLGAYGEAGAVVTRDAALAAKCRMLRNHGMVERYLHEDIGYNYRMNSFQGAVLQVKLRHLEDWTQQRIALAERYDRLLADVPVTRPALARDGRAVHHLYVIRHPRRDALRDELAKRGVETAVHYPRAIHQQPVLERYGFERQSLAHTEAIARECISLPLYPEMPPSRWTSWRRRCARPRPSSAELPGADRGSVAARDPPQHHRRPRRLHRQRPQVGRLLDRVPAASP